jgi:hypothetical protein
MEAGTIYEKEILKDIHELSEHNQKKLLKIIRFFTKEIIESQKNEKQLTDEFLSACGTWEDERSIEEQINDIYSSRNSRKATKGMI